VRIWAASLLLGLSSIGSLISTAHALPPIAAGGVASLQPSQREGDGVVDVIGVRSPAGPSSASEVSSEPVSSRTTAARIVEGTLSSRITMLLADPLTDTVYVADAGNRRVVAINTRQQAPLQEVNTRTEILDIAIGKGRHRKLAIAAGTSGIQLLDLEEDRPGVRNHWVRSLTLPPEMSRRSVVSVAFDGTGNLFASVAGRDHNDHYGKVYWLDGTTGALIREFGSGPELANLMHSGSLLRTNATGTALFVGGRSLSPLTLDRFNIAARSLTHVASRATHGEFGGNLQDLCASGGRGDVLLAAGGPYVAQRIDPQTVRRVAQYPVGAYPSAVTGRGNRVFATSTSALTVQIFDRESGARQTLAAVELPEVRNQKLLARGLAVSRNGRKVYVVVGSDSSDGRAAVEVIPVPRMRRQVH
jgi:DNA-binding beta-propeller fold protein YncE